MISTQPIGLTNTGLPVAVLVAGAAGLPWVIAPKGSLSQGRLAVAVGVTALVLLLVGTGMFAAFYALQGAQVSGALANDTIGVLGFFFRLSLKAMLFWVPVLVLAWYVMAQGVERRRGEAIAREGRR